MHIQEWKLYQPEEEEADHSIRLDALRFWNMVWKREKRGPDSAEHNAHGIRTVHGLDCEPKDGENGAGYDGDVRAPEAPGSSRQYWKWCVIFSPSALAVLLHMIIDLRMTPVAPLRAMTKDMRKKAKATMPSDSRHVRPMAIIPEANCHVAALEGC